MSSKSQHNHWLHLEVKHLIVWHNQKSDPYCEIKNMVPKIPQSWLNHTLYWLVTVLMWCRNVKPEIYKYRYASLTAVKNLLKLTFLSIVVYYLFLYDFLDNFKNRLNNKASKSEQSWIPSENDAYSSKHVKKMKVK